MTPENTFAYLIAVENYTDDKALHPLPQSFTNVSELYKILKSPLVGIPGKTNIGRSIDPKDGKVLIKEIKQLIEAPEAKTLILYYAGHGILDDDGNHYLSLTNSTVDSIDIDGLDIDDLSKAWGKKKNINVILILDSCFSENAFDEFKGRNFLLMASSAKNRTSKYPVDADYSAFTGELLKVMKEGVEVDSKTLSWKDIYGQVKTNLKEKGFPAPKISTQNEVEMLEACANRFNTKEVSMEDRWIRLIKEEIGNEHPAFREAVVGILNAGGAQAPQKLKELLLNVFPYPIAYHLNALFDKNVESASFFSFYESVIRFLFIVNFMHFERLKSSGKIQSGKEFRAAMMDFSEPDHEFYLNMLEIIHNDLKANKASKFMDEFDFFNPDFQKIIQGIEKERIATDVKTNVVKDLVFRMIPYLKYFLNYKLLSIKDVNLSFRKYNHMEFNHSVSLLQGNYETNYEVWTKMDEPWQKAFVQNPEAKNSRSVVFMDSFEENMGDYLNLWPLIVDKNALEDKASVPEIYLFSGVDEDDNYLYEKLDQTNHEEKKTLNDLEALAISSKLDAFKEITRI